MSRLIASIFLTLAACAGDPAPVAPPDTDVRPVVAKDNLQGRWAIVAVDGQRVERLWLTLGGEGPTTVTRTDSGVFVGSPQPVTRAFLGCNDLRLQGWTRNGDKLALGIDYSSRTERGCDPVTMAREEQVYTILRQAMTMEFTPPDRMRLINESGTLDLVRGAG